MHKTELILDLAGQFAKHLTESEAVVRYKAAEARLAADRDLFSKVQDFLSTYCNYRLDSGSADNEIVLGRIYAELNLIDESREFFELQAEMIRLFADVVKILEKSIPLSVGQ